MAIKGIYRSIMHGLEAIPCKLDLLKTTIAENHAIASKRSIYETIKWTHEQQEQFDAFWLDAYGKKISNKWHRLYQATSGVFAVDYIPEKLYTTQIEPRMNDYNYAHVLEDKSFIEFIGQGCGCYVPETLIVCCNGQFYNHSRIPISKGNAEKILIGREFVLKPTIGSSSGHGVVFADASQTVSKHAVEALLKQQGKDFIAQTAIKPHQVFASFNSTSINTIRITTFIANDEMHHVPLAFRIGRQNKRVDNIHAGGIGVGVKDDGCLLAEAYEPGYGNQVTKYRQHPDSGILFDGCQLPKIPEIINVAYRAHGKMPHIGIVSWDFTVDDAENVVLIEANIIGQGIWFPQMIHGAGPFGEFTKNVLKRIR